MPPPAPAPSRYLLPAFALAYAGAVIGYLPLLSLLLPIKIERIAGDARIGLFTITIVAGALVASAANVLFGWLSDRSVAAGGGRRRWIAGGLAGTASSYALIGVAQGPAAIVAAVMLFQLAVNAILAPLMAIMADEIPDDRRGLAGGLLALGQPAAGLVSALVVAASGLDEPARLACVLLATGGALLPLLSLRARATAAIVPAPAAAARAPIGRRDLFVASGARLLVQIAGSALSLYLLYYFQSVAPGIPSAALATQVGTLLTVCYVLPLPVAIFAGRLSDRVGRRKPFLVGAALAAAAGLVVMALVPDRVGGAAGFALYAAGSAVFLSLHSAFAIQLLPDPRHRGRDMGLLNLANTLPALIGPLLTWTLATPQDFAPLLLALALLTLAGGAIVLATHGRRV